MTMPVKPVLQMLAVLSAAVLSAAPAGCASSKRVDAEPPTRSVLRVTNHVGGTHYRTIMHGDRWYQTFSNELLVINPRSARVIETVELSDFGTTGPASDMAVANGDLYIILRDDEVLQLSIEQADRPAVVQRVTAGMLGIAPRHLSVVSEDGTDAVYVCGPGGAVRFPGGPIHLRGQGEVTSVARAEMGLVATVGRRVYTLDDERYVGSASSLQPMPRAGADADDDLIDGTMIFTRVGSTGTLIGLMDPNVRERSTSKSTTAVGGAVHRVRWFDGSMWIVGDEEILSYTPTDQGLEIRDVIRVKGARDVDMLRDNYLAVAGTFGRAVYRIESDASGHGDTFLGAQREPSRLSVAISDRMTVLAGSAAEGMWMYQIGSEAKLSDKVMTKDVPTSKRAVIDDGTARVSDDGDSLVLDSNDVSLRWSPSDAFPGAEHTVHCVIAVEGRLWVGHDRGLAVLEYEAPTAEQVDRARRQELPIPQPQLVELGSVRLDGPVNYLIPLLTGRGAAYVAEYGGFGTAEVFEEPIGNGDSEES